MTRDDLKKELDGLWNEKQEIDNPKVIDDEDFIPAQEAEIDDRPPLIHIDL